MPCCIRVLQENKTNKMFMCVYTHTHTHTYRERFIIKELDHIIMGKANPNIWRIGQ